MNIAKLNIGQRLALGFGVIIAFLIMLAAISYIRINSLNDEITLIVKDRYPKTTIANNIKAQINEVSRNMLNVLIMTDEGQIKKEIANIEVVNANNNEAIANLNKIITDAKGKELLAAINVIRDKFLPAQNGFVKLVNEDKKDEALLKFLFSLRPQQSKYFVALDDFIKYQNSQMEQAGEQSALLAKQTEFLTI